MVIDSASKRRMKGDEFASKFIDSFYAHVCNAKFASNKELFLEICNAVISNQGSAPPWGGARIFL